MLNRFRSGRFRIPVVAVLFAALAAAVSGCEHAVRVPPEDYGEVEQTLSDEWEIETKDMIYRVNWFTVTDSTIVILDAQWKESKVATDRYPENIVKRVVNPEVPIVLSRKDVTSVGRVEPSKGRTGVAVGVVIIVAAAAALVAFVALVAASIPAD